jgi:glycosyltransferase involved in cell wall biosynthesis
MRLDSNEYDYDVSYVGRLTFQKNPQRLMRVFKLLKDKKPDVKIAVIGTGNLEEETKTLANEYQLTDNVSFFGFQSNPLKILHDSKVMIMTSRWEGTPMCALEAMALGVPIVSTPSDGICELVTDGENGFLSDNDSILAQKVLDIIADKNVQSDFSNNTKSKSLVTNDIEVYKRTILNAYTD